MAFAGIGFCGYLPQSRVPDTQPAVLRIVLRNRKPGVLRVHRAGLANFLIGLGFWLLGGLFVGGAAAQGFQTELAERLDWVAERAARKARKERIELQLSRMTLEEKAAQLLFIDIRPTGQSSGKQWSTEWRDFVARYPVGGLILFRSNLQDKAQLQALLQDMRTDSAFARIQVLPLLGVDEEGGAVSRLAGLRGLGYSGLQPAFQKAPDTLQAALRGEFLGKLLGELGFNLNMAPVADLYARSSSFVRRGIVIGQRAFSADPSQAASLVAAFVRSMQSRGVAAVLKHFPGHGYTFGDPHSGASVYKGDMARYRDQGQALPFAAGIRAGAGFVMLGHFQMPQILGSNIPASLSGAVIGQMLRRGLGFRGVVISDSFDMQAIAARWDSAAATVKFLLAGGDMPLMPPDPAAAIAGVVAAVQDGRLSKARIDESLRRILRQKQRLGLLPELR